MKTLTEKNNRRELKKYLRKINKRIGKMTPKDSQGIMYMPEDLKHWKLLGVKTPADLDRYMLLTATFELAKDLGGDPDWKQMNELTYEELKKDYEALVSEATAKLKSEDESV